MNWSRDKLHISQCQQLVMPLHYTRAALPSPLQTFNGDNLQSSWSGATFPSRCKWWESGITWPKNLTWTQKTTWSSKHHGSCSLDDQANQDNLFNDPGVVIYKSHVDFSHVDHTHSRFWQFCSFPWFLPGKSVETPDLQVCFFLIRSALSSSGKDWVQWWENKKFK